MTVMTFVCDYAKIDPMTLMYKVDHIVENAFSTYEDSSEDVFLLHVFPVNERKISKVDRKKLTKLIHPYIWLSEIFD